MGRPLSKKDISKKIYVKAFIGNAVVDAWITEQVGTNSYVVTDGVSEIKVQLQATTPTIEGQAQLLIETSDGSFVARTLQQNQVKVFSGEVFTWSFDEENLPNKQVRLFSEDNPPGYNIRAIFNGVDGFVFLPGTQFGVCYEEATGASASTVSSVNGPVGTYHDLVTDKYLVAVNGANRPTYRYDAVNERYYVESTQVNQGLSVTFNIDKPFQRLSGFRIVEHSTNSGVLYFNNATQGSISQPGTVGSLEFLGVNSGSGLTLAVDAVQNDLLVEITTIPNAGSIRINEEDPNMVTMTSVSQHTGVTLFARNTGTFGAKVRIYSDIIRDGVLDAEDLAELREYLNTKLVF